MAQDELTPMERNALKWVLFEERFALVDGAFMGEGQKWLRIKEWMEMMSNDE